MRVVYSPISVREFEILLNRDRPQRGGAISDIRTYQAPAGYYQKGSGIFSILGNIVRNSIPYIKRFILPSAMDFAGNVMKDYSSGSNNLKRSLKKHGVSAIKDIGKKILKGGRRRYRGKTKTDRKRRVKKGKSVNKIKRRVKRGRATAQRNKQTCRELNKDIFSQHFA